VALIAAGLVAVVAGKKLAADTLLGAIAHGGLAMGLVAISLVPGVRVDLESFLFGDILAVTRTDLAVIWIGVVVILSTIVWFWRGMLLCTLNEDLALAEGHHPLTSRLALMVMLALLVAISLKIVGALLITALMILPAAAARYWAASPLQMAFLAGGIGVACIFGGMGLSLEADTPTGPSIVVCAVAIFAVSSLLRQGAR
jgi:zinc transport system permease protein